MHPILFQIGSLPIGTYGVLIVVGMLSALWLAARLAWQRGLAPDFFYDLTFVLLVSGFLGARLLYIMTEWGEFVQNPMAILLSRSGFVFQGGFIAALAAGIAYTFWKKMPLLEVADIVAPALALAHAFGRIGCHFAGCCFGKVCTDGAAHSWESALAVHYPLLADHGRPIEMFNFAYWTQVGQGLIGPDAAGPLPVLPVQLFESAGNFILCAVVLWVWSRRRFAGQAFALYLALYSVMRFGLEFLRGDVERGLYFGGAISTGQIIAAATLAAAALLWAARRGKALQPVLAPAEESIPQSRPAEVAATRPTRRRR